MRLERRKLHNFLASEVPSAIHVSRGTLQRFSTYANLLTRWQAKINLIGQGTIEDLWSRHFLDSLQLSQYIDDKNASIVDMGSGAGFPGMVLAIAGYSNCRLIDSDLKKCLFLQEVSRETSTNVSIIRDRIESVNLEQVDYILARACAPLNLLMSHASRFVSHGTICFFHKGTNYTNELEEAHKTWNFDYEIIPSSVNKDSVLLKIEHLVRKI